MSRPLFTALAVSLSLVTASVCAESGKPADTPSAAVPTTSDPIPTREIGNAPVKAKARAGTKAKVSVEQKDDGDVAGRQRTADMDQKRNEQDKLIARRNAAWDASMKKTMSGICTGC